jgi:hypothetical protein
MAAKIPPAAMVARSRLRPWRGIVFLDTNSTMSLQAMNAHAAATDVPTKK